MNKRFGASLYVAGHLLSPETGIRIRAEELMRKEPSFECGIISNRNEVECIILSSVLISTPFIPSGLGRKEIDCPYIYMSPSL